MKITGISLEELENFIAKYPESNRKNDILLLQGYASMELSGSDSLDHLTPAIGLFESITIDNPEVYLKSRLALGQTYEMSGDTLKAVETYRYILNSLEGQLKVPESLLYSARINLALLYMKHGNESDSIDLLENLLVSGCEGEDGIKVRHLLAECYEKFVLTDREIFIYEELLDLYSREKEVESCVIAMINHKLADAYRSAGEVKKAITLYKANIDNYPECPVSSEVLFSLGEIYIQEGKNDDALDSFLNIIDKYPKSEYVVNVTLHIANIYFSNAEWKKAAAYYESVSDTSSKNEEIALRFISSLYQSDQVKKANSRIKDFHKKFGKKRKTEALFLYEQSSQYLREGKRKRGKDGLEKVLKDYEDTQAAAISLYDLGMIALKDNDVDSAYEAFLLFEKKYPSDNRHADVLKQLGDISVHRRNPADAVQFYRKALGEEADSGKKATILWNAAVTYYDIGQFERCIEFCRELIDRYPDNEQTGRARVKIGMCLLELGNNLAAVAHLTKILEGPHDVESETEIRYFIGEAYFQAGQYEEAVKRYLRLSYTENVKDLWVVTALFKAGLAYEHLDMIPRAKEIYRLLIRKYGAESQWGQSAKSRLDLLK